MNKPGLTTHAMVQQGRCYLADPRYARKIEEAGAQSLWWLLGLMTKELDNFIEKTEGRPSTLNDIGGAT